MKFNLGTVFALLPYLQLAMQKAQGIKDAKGLDKRKVAIQDFAATAVQALEAGLDKDVVNDPMVLQAVGSVMDAIKNFENVLVDVKSKHVTK